MSDQRLDAERLALLLDGRLPTEARERLMAEIVADPEAAAILAEAAAALRQAEAAGVAGAKSPAVSGDSPASDLRDPVSRLRAAGDLGESVSSLPARRSSSRRRHWRPLLAAASIVAAAAIGAGIWQATRASGLDATFGAIAAVRPAGTMPDDWSDPPWARTRGADPPAAMPALSAMIGARVADLEVATRRAPARVPALAGAVSQLVRRIAGSGPALARWDAAAEGSARNAEWLEEGREAVEPLVEAVPYELGAILEGIRLALLAGDNGASRALADRLTTLVERGTLPRTASDEATRLAAVLAEDATIARNRDERLRAVDAAFRALF